MKTAPFYSWLKRNGIGKTSTVYYGFSAEETLRIQRRSSAMALLGIPVAFPLAHWPRTIHSISEVGLQKPEHYDTWKHGNCIGCLKAGIQHWYVVYCKHPSIFFKGVKAEEALGHSIIKGYWLVDLIDRFEEMKQKDVPANENIPSTKFHSIARQPLTTINLPCECSD
jgi:hypothetical protein